MPRMGQQPEPQAASATGVEVSLRELDESDRELLIVATLDNMNWCGERFTREQVIVDPAISHYFTSWRSDRDLGLVAVDQTGHPLGAVWTCLVDGGDSGYGFVRDDVPELSIWVEAGHRSCGIGSVLMSALIERARSVGLGGISLSVEEGNPARKLYERCGFVPAGPEFDPGTMVLWL